MKHIVLFLLAIFLIFGLAACGPLPEGSNPLNTPGDVARVRYLDSDIHHRTFGSDYGH